MKVGENKAYHAPVLLNEAIEYLRVIPGCWYVDATAGGGGHTAALIQQGARVLAIDQDKDAIAHLTKIFEAEINQRRLRIRRGNFSYLAQLKQEAHVGQIRGVLFDLGMSTHQIRDSGRGFSFRGSEPLDMRMSEEVSITAEEIINNYSEEKLYEIFRKFGEEQLARPIARAICRARSIKPIIRTDELVSIICSVYGTKQFPIHPATRTFQALRIAVNDELNELRRGLRQALELVEKKGRIVTISFHSLEDRIAKQFFLEQSRQSYMNILTKRPVRSSEKELTLNPAARSAKLRAGEKI